MSVMPRLGGQAKQRWGVKAGVKSVEQNGISPEKKFPFPLPDPRSALVPAPQGSGGLWPACSPLKALELIS